MYLAQVSQLQMFHVKFVTLLLYLVFSGICTWVFIFITTFYSLHVSINICTFCSLNLENWLITLGLTHLREVITLCR